MTCEAVREELGEYVLGSLPEREELAVRRHLRGCGSCRQELNAVGEGLTTFARAAHQAEPPPELRDRVLEALEEERAETPQPERRFRPALAWAAVLVLLAGSLAWGALATKHAADLDRLAGRYSAFLDVLGGKDVRVGTLAPRAARPVEGSVVMYDSEKGQSWVLVLVRSAGASGEARVVLSSASRPGRIALHPITFDPDGEGSTWLVTSADLTRFDRCRLLDPSGHVIASGRISEE